MKISEILSLFVSSTMAVTMLTAMLFGGFRPFCTIFFASPYGDC